MSRSGALPSAGSRRVVSAGNLGAAYTLALNGEKDVWLVGTLNADTTITVSGLTAGAAFRLLLSQDATGGRVVTLSDGTGSLGVPVNAGASAVTVIDGSSPDGTDIDLSGSGVTPPETVTTVATAGAAQTIPTATGVYDFTLTAPALVLTLPTPVAGKSFSLVLRQDATGSRVVTWPAAKWPGGAAPTLTTTPAAVDLVSFLCVNGTDWFGFPSGYDLR